MTIVTTGANALRSVPEISWTFAFLLLIATYLGHALVGYLRLRHIPGPFIPSISNIPRLYWVLTGRAHDIHIALHERYGSLVRMGPNMVSVGDPKEIGKIYGITGRYKKVCGNYYSGLRCEI